MYKNNADWAPSVNLGHNKPRTGKSESALERDKEQKGVKGNAKKLRSRGKGQKGKKRKRQEAEQEADQRVKDGTLVTANMDDGEQSKSSCNKEPETE